MTRLDAIRQRVERATKGPWQKYSSTTVLVHDNGKNIRYIVPPDDMCPEEQREEDADFIAHSREDIPALLAVVDKADLKRNTRVTADKKLAGEWVAIPAEDFDALRAALAPLLQEVER